MINVFLTIKEEEKSLCKEYNNAMLGGEVSTWDSIPKRNFLHSVVIHRLSFHMIDDDDGILKMAWNTPTYFRQHEFSIVAHLFSGWYYAPYIWQIISHAWNWKTHNWKKNDNQDSIDIIAAGSIYKPIMFNRTVLIDKIKTSPIIKIC